MSYLLLIVLTLVIGFAATGWCKHALNSNAKKPISSGLTGAEAARRMLEYYGVQGVPITMGGAGDDFYDPRSRSITLSPDAFSTASITSLATACHEVGHACQHYENYAPMKARTAIVPAVNLCSNVWMFVLIAGILLSISGLIWVAIALYAVAIVFHLVTLPVEFDASRRALKYLKTIGAPKPEIDGSAAVLRACAFTYVAAALTSILQLVYLLGMARSNE